MSTNESSTMDQLSTEELASKLHSNLLPKHVAIIMDGNGRWAESRHLPRIAGHREGIKSVREIVQACSDLGIQALTIYAFSQENWNRPLHEVSALMDLLEYFLAEERTNLIEQGVRFRTIGRLEDLPPSAIQWVRDTEQATAHLDKLYLTVALSYGVSAQKSWTRCGKFCVTRKRENCNRTRWMKHWSINTFIPRGCRTPIS